jgi:hypothetical protein
MTMLDPKKLAEWTTSAQRYTAAAKEYAERLAERERTGFAVTGYAEEERTAAALALKMVASEAVPALLAEIERLRGETFFLSDKPPRFVEVTVRADDMEEARRIGKSIRDTYDLLRACWEELRTPSPPGGWMDERKRREPLLRRLAAFVR